MVEIWRYRDLLWHLALRDLAIRYKQTLLGGAWAVLQPLLQVAAFTIVFGLLAKLETGGTPYPLFALAGLLPWQQFASSLGHISNSIVQNAHLISKVYFPRLIVPLSSVVPSLVDLAVGLVILLLAMAWYGVSPSWRLLALPAFLGASQLVSFAFGLWFTALNVRFRDVRQAVPFLVQFWLYASPVAYPRSLVPERWRAFYDLNPMVVVIEGFRWALLGHPFEVGRTAILSMGMCGALLLSALWFFRRSEDTFADTV